MAAFIRSKFSKTLMASPFLSSEYGALIFTKLARNIVNANGKVAGPTVTTFLTSNAILLYFMETPFTMISRLSGSQLK